MMRLLQGRGELQPYRAPSASVFSQGADLFCPAFGAVDMASEIFFLTFAGHLKYKNSVMQHVVSVVLIKGKSSTSKSSPHFAATL